MPETGPTFRLLVTGDLHYDLRGKDSRLIEELARRVCASDADALVVAGDVSPADNERLTKCLDLFSGFKGEKLIVPGNHDLWTLEGDSEQIYREQFPAAALEAGFHMLDGHPVQFGPVAVVGNIGWYDYSFRDRRLRLRMSRYEQKRWPGVATFNDVRFVQWRYSDEEFTRMCCEQLREDIRAVNDQSSQIVAVTHFLPFPELVPDTQNPRYRFAQAFVGARCLGTVLKRFKSVRYAFCGHIHVQKEVRLEGMRAFSLAGGRDANTLYELSLPSGKVDAHLFELPR